MDIAARLSSKGQITVPKPVREALELDEGDPVTFRIEDGRATLAKTEDFLDMAGSVDVPASKRGTPWDEVRRETSKARARAGR